jgi:hypothetical protein
VGPSVQFRGGKKSLAPCETPYSFLLLTSRPDGVGKDGGVGKDDDNVIKKRHNLNIHVIIRMHH